MSSLAIVPPLLLLCLPPLCLAFLLRMWMSGTLTISPAILFGLIALSSVAAGVVKLAVNAFPSRLDGALETTLECLLSAAVLFILRRLVHYRTASPIIFSSLHSFAALLIVCELVSSVISRSPILLPPIFSTVTRLLSAVLLILVIRACPSYSHEEHSNVEKHDLDQFRFAHEFPVRGSSPSADTWPFPAFLAFSRSNLAHTSSSPGNNSIAANLGSSFPLRGDTEHANPSAKSTSTLIFPILAGSQFFALLCAAIKIVMAVIVSHSTKTDSNQGAKSLVTVWHLFIIHGVCRSVWAVLILTVIYVMPPKPLLVPSVEVRPPKKQPTLRPFIPGIHTPRPSFSRFLSPDSASEYLSVPDPFASIPPPLPPPPVVSVGLDLDEVDNRCNGRKEIRVQYRFPAPRSRTWRKHKSKKSCSTSGKWSLDHKSSVQSLSSCPPLLSRNGGIYAGRADCGADQDKDGGLKDEAILAQRLLQSLSLGATEDLSTAPKNEISPITTLWGTSIPRALYTPPRSRWSSSSTVMSATTVRPNCSSMPRSRVSSTSAGLAVNTVPPDLPSVVDTMKST